MKESSSTLLHIAQMAHYQMEYMQKRNAGDKEKMIQYTLLSGAGILSLLTMGILGLIESRKKT